jgi:hypothetical protein
MFTGTPWRWHPDWARGILERLEFRTDVLRSFNAREQRRKLRNGARRQIEFDVLVTERDRKLLETHVAGWQARTWAVPLYWDARHPSADLSLGVTSIPVDTTNSELQAGRLAMLQADDGRSEVVEVTAVNPTSIDLADPTTSAWAASARLYPATTATLEQAIPINRFDGTTGYLRARFTAKEAANWAATPPATTYLGYPVFTQRPLVGNEITLGISRKTEEFDGGIGPTYLDDEGGLALFEQTHGWMATEEIDALALRGLFYYLAGRYGAVWMPTWTDDLTVAANIANGAATIDIVNNGYNAFLAQQPGRNHIAIYLRDGTVLYRKITASTQLSGALERLTVTPVAPSAIAAADVVRVSFMQLMRQAGDGTEIVHWTGQAVEATSTFVSFRHDL